MTGRQPPTALRYLREFFRTLAMLSAIASFLFAFSSHGAMHIMLDPGHGGVDKGAVRGKLKEAEIALIVANMLADRLKSDPRFEVSMTRTTNEAISLARRTEIAQESGADLFLSIHLNSSNDPRAHGKEFYFQNQLAADEESLYLASRENLEEDASNSESAKPENVKAEKLSSKSDLKRILEDLHDNHRIRASSDLSKILLETWIARGNTHKTGSRAIRQAPFQVVKNVSVPSVLVELGFISHATEGPRLATPEYQAALAHSLYEGLVKYKETMDKDRGEKLSSPNAK